MERYGGGALLELGAAALERTRNFFLGDVDRLRLFTQLGERLLLQLLAPVLFDQRLAVLLRRSEPCALQLLAVIIVSSFAF